MKQFRLTFLAFILASGALAGPTIHSQLTDTNASRELHLPGYSMATTTAMAAVTNRITGDVCYVAANNKYYYWSGSAWTLFAAPVTAASVTFDNSGTDYTATNVQDAIVQVDHWLNGSVTFSTDLHFRSATNMTLENIKASLILGTAGDIFLGGNSSQGFTLSGDDASHIVEMTYTDDNDNNFDFNSSGMFIYTNAGGIFMQDNSGSLMNLNGDGTSYLNAGGGQDQILLDSNNDLVAIQSGGGGLILSLNDSASSLFKFVGGSVDLGGNAIQNISLISSGAGTGGNLSLSSNIVSIYTNDLEFDTNQSGNTFDWYGTTGTTANFHSIDVAVTGKTTTTTFNISGAPVTDTGLVSGDVWRDPVTNNLKIVP